MKLDWNIKYIFTWHLKELHKKNTNSEMIQILENILDENQPSHSLEKDIIILNHLITSKSAHSLEASFILGMCYQYSIGINKDEKRAVELYQLAANQGHEAAQSHLGFCYRQGIGVSKDEKRAVELYQLAANQGHAAAQNNLGFCYQYSIGVNKDEKLAVELYQLGANQGYAAAQSNLGICYDQGVGVNKDIKRAVELYQLAVSQGHAAAQNNLGMCYLQGIGVNKDVKRVVELYQLAANQGYAAAQNNLGFCYQQGTGVNKDEKRAVELYQLAANQGYAVAQSNLGLCYNEGIGVNKDVKRAVELYQLAANQGYASAQYNLGVCYRQGIGVNKDEKRAVLLLQAATKQGISDANTSLNNIYANNKPFPNLDDALLHYRALAFDDKDTQIVKDMSSLTTLAFCYQMGLGAEKDLKKAIELYQLAMRKGSDCLWDLFSCYRNQYEMEMKLDNLVDFYAFLQQDSNKNAKAAILLAYLYENGAPGLEQNLYSALKYYERAKAIEVEYSNNKIQYYTPLLNLKNQYQEFFPSGLVSIIAEYAFENNNIKNSN